SSSLLLLFSKHHRTESSGCRRLACTTVLSDGRTSWSRAMSQPHQPHVREALGDTVPPSQATLEPGALSPGPHRGPAEPPSGQLVRYPVYEELGRGGMGAVLRGRDLVLDRDLAIKVILDPVAADAGVVQRFEAEARIGGRLQHPGIVPVYELGRAGEGRPYFTIKQVGSSPP